MLACICDERTNKQLAVYLNGVDNVYLQSRYFNKGINL